MGKSLIIKGADFSANCINSYLEVDTSTLELKNGLIDTETLKWIVPDSTQYQYNIIDIQDHQFISVQIRPNASTNNLRLAFLTSDAAVNGQVAAFCEDTSLIMKDAGYEPFSIEVPQDCKYVYLFGHGTETQSYATLFFTD